MGRAVATVSGRPSSPSSAESSFRELDDVFLQTQTRIWLGEVLQERMDEHLNISDLLADGELLFQVSKVIFSLLLKKCKELQHIDAHKYNPLVSRRVSGRYKPYSNVDSFLKICKILGLNGIDLFSPSDVVERRDTRKVCVCIRALSKKARSKQLNVPDFDVVTYTVTMPTSLVGCIRRRLEQSQCDFQMTNYAFFNSSKSKHKQKNSAAVCERNYDSWLEEYDEAESRYVGAESFSVSASNSDDSTFSSDLEISPEVCSTSRKLQSAGRFEHDHYDSSGSIDLETPLPSHMMKNYDVDHGSPNDESIEIDYLEENQAELSYLSNGLTFSDLISLATDGSSPVLFNGEDMFNIVKESESSLRQRTYYRCRRRNSDELDDVEVSSTDSMSSVLGRMLNLDFENQFEEQDFQIAKGDYTRFLDTETETDTLDRSSVIECRFEDIDECESSILVEKPETNEPHFKVKLKNTDFNAEYLSTCQVDWKSHRTEHQVIELFNKISISQTGSGKAMFPKVVDLPISNDNETINEEDNDTGNITFNPGTESIKQGNKCIRSRFCDAKNVIEDSNALRSSVSAEGNRGCQGNLHNQNRITLNDSRSGTAKAALLPEDNCGIGGNFVTNETFDLPASENDSCLDNADEMDCQQSRDHKEKRCRIQHTNHVTEGITLGEENSNKIEDTTSEPSKEKSRLKSLLKTVAKGTALVGALALFLHFRNRGGIEKMGKKTKQTGQIHKTNVLQFSSEKEEKGDRMNGIYPAKNLKLGS